MKWESLVVIKVSTNSNKFFIKDLQIYTKIATCHLSGKITKREHSTMGVACNKEPSKPIPLSKKDMSKLFNNAIIQEHNNIIVFLKYRIDFSRPKLETTALDKNKNKIE